VTYGYGCFDAPLHVTSSETASAVSIEVTIRRPPSRGRLCTLQENFRVTRVSLREPLGLRRLVHPPAQLRLAAYWPLDCARLARARRDAARGDKTAARALKRPVRMVLAAERVCAT
jgi:hypothetical protein